MLKTLARQSLHQALKSFHLLLNDFFSHSIRKFPPPRLHVIMLIIYAVFTGLVIREGDGKLRSISINQSGWRKE